MIAQVVAEIGFPLARQGENLHFDKEVYKHVAGSTDGDEPEVYQYDRVDKMPPGAERQEYQHAVELWGALANGLHASACYSYDCCGGKEGHQKMLREARDICNKLAHERKIIKDRVRLWLSSVWDRAEKAIDAGIPVSYCDEAGIVEVDVDGVKRYTPNGSTRITFEIGPFVTELPMRKNKQPEEPSELEPIIVPPRRAPVSEEYLRSMGFVYHDGKGGNPKRFWQRGSVLIASERDGYRAYVTPDPECNSHPNAAAARVVARRDVEMLVQLFGE